MTESVKEYDLIGIIKYKELCKEEGIVPFRKVINSLSLEELDLKVIFKIRKMDNFPMKVTVKNFSSTV